MVVPAGIYLALNATGPAASGWGIPMATDIAMAVGLLAIVGSRVPVGVKVFLLALAIVDDIGAIVVIAAFYTSDVSGAWLAFAVAMVVVMLGMRRRVRSPWAYVVPALVVWFAIHESGVHATIAGVVLGLMTPARPYRTQRWIDAAEATIEEAGIRPSPAQADRLVEEVRQSVSVVEWLEHGLHPWSSKVILPIFALANAGVVLSSDLLAEASSSPVTWGVVLGLVVGKGVGITLFTWLTVRMKIGALPTGATWRHVGGVSLVAGMGFTVSLFIAGLAFDDDAITSVAKVGILVGTLISAVVGARILGTGPKVDVDTSLPTPAGHHT